MSVSGYHTIPELTSLNSHGWWIWQTAAYAVFSWFDSSLLSWVISPPEAMLLSWLMLLLEPAVVYPQESKFQHTEPWQTLHTSPAFL